MRLHILNQLLAAFTAFLTIFYAGIWRGYKGLIISKFRAGEVPIPLASDDIPRMVALSDFSGLFSVFPIAYVTNRFGRLIFLRLAFILFVSGSALFLTATSRYHIFFASSLIGVGRAVGAMASPFYVAEIAQAKYRGALSSINVLMMTGSIAVIFTVGPLISFTHRTWAILLCPLASLLLSFVVPESPYLCLIRNNATLAFRALSRLRDKKKSEENSVELELISKNMENARQSKRNWAEMISDKGNRRGLMIILSKAALHRAGGWNTITTYSPAVLPADSSWNPDVSVLITLWLMVVFSLAGMSLVDRLGCKPLQMVSTFALTIIIAVLAVFYYFYQKPDVDLSLFVFVPHIGLILGGIFYPFGNTVNVYRGELLSPIINGRASATVLTVQLAISCVINKIFFAVDQCIGVYFTFATFSTFHLLDMLFTARFIFETKGKTLADIQNTLKR